MQDINDGNSDMDIGECFKKFIYYIGSIVALTSISFDFIYVRKSPFNNQTLFVVLSIIIVLRLLIIIIYASHMFFQKVINEQPGNQQELSQIQ